MLRDLQDIVGNKYWGILGQLVIDPETNRKRVIVMGNQEIPAGIFVECSKDIREKADPGTIFKMNVGVSRKPRGRVYVHSLKKHELLTEQEWNVRSRGR